MGNLEKRVYILLFILLIVVKISYAACPSIDESGNPTYSTCTTQDVQNIQPSDIAKIPADQVPSVFDSLSSSQRQELTPDQLMNVLKSSKDLGDLGQYNTANLKGGLQAAGYNINNLQGDLSGTKIEGTNLVLSDGSTYDLKSGNQISLETSGGKTTYFSDNQGTIFINAENVQYSSSAIRIGQADSITYQNSVSRNVLQFTGETGRFSVNSADIVIVEQNIVFNKIKNSTFVLQNGKLLSASVVSNQINNTVKIPNLIPQSSQYINVNYNLNSGFGVNYRTDPNKIEFRADENVSLWLLNERNVSFVSYSNNSYFAIIKDVPPIYRIKNGILNYSTNETVEQLESTCGLTDVNIDFRIGFVKAILSPANVTVLCAGSRYNLIDKFMREKSYSIYNTGDNDYYLGFEKGMQLTDFNSFITSLAAKAHGFIGKAQNIELNGIIEYDRTPEKDLFPGLNYSEYLGSPISWKEVVLSNAEDISISIAALNERINITARTNGTTLQENTTVFEVNSGFFNIREIQKDTMRRYGSFNKKVIYPDYVEAFQFNDEPPITIENKKLTETEPDGRVIDMFTPGTQESNSFLDWLKIKMAIKDIYEWMKRMAGK